MLQCYANIHNIVACCKSEMQNAIQDESCFLCIFVNFIRKNYNSDQLNYNLDQSNSSFTTSTS